MNTIGFIGLGEMGMGMAINIIKAGFPLHVYDVRQEHIKKIIPFGASEAKSPKEVAQKSDCILLSLPDTKAVMDVLFGEAGIVQGARKNAIVIDCGTTNPLVTRQINDNLKKKRILFLDAPVSGMKARAQQGTLTVMVGGEKTIFKKVKPILSAIGNQIIYMGRSGNGQLAKLVNQILFNINTAAIAEILPLAVKLGLEPEKLYDVVRTGTGASFAFEFFVPLILQNNFEPGYHLLNAYKDIATISEISMHEKIPLPLTAAATLTYQLALAKGLGNENKGAMIKVWEDIFGITVRPKNINIEKKKRTIHRI